MCNVLGIEKSVYTACFFIPLLAVIQLPHFLGKEKVSMGYRGGSRIFQEGDLNIEVIYEAGGHSPPEAIGCFSNITLKSCLMQDLEHI